MKRPEKNEYAEYYEAYVGRVPDRALLDVLAEAPDALQSLLAPVSIEQETFAYAPGKWTIRQVVAHVLDTERLFGYRALHVARGDPSPLPGMDQDVWMANSNAAERTLAEQIGEFRALRASHVALFGSFDDDVLARTGLASGVRFSTRALVFIVVGHEIHHRGVLAERYVPLPTAGTS